MKLWGVLILAVLGIATIASSEILHPSGGSAPLEGLPLRMEFGGTGNSFDSFVDGDCVETYVDDNGTPGDLTDDLMKQRGSGSPCGSGAASDVICTGCISTTDILDGTIVYVDVNSTQTITADPANGDSSVWFGTTGLIFEGTTSDTNEGLLNAAAITADRTWTLPNESGTICTLTSGCGTPAGAITAVGPACLAGACLMDETATTGTTMFVWEGTTADAFEFRIAAGSADPLADVTATFPDLTGTVQLNTTLDTCAEQRALSSEVTGTCGNLVFSTSPTLTTPVLGSANITAASNLTSNGFVKTGGGVGTLSVDTATYLTAEVDGSITNELPIAGVAIDISGSPASTVDWDSTEVTNTTWSANGSATIAHTFATSGTNDVTMNYTDGACTVAATGTPTFKLDDSDIALSGDGNADVHLSVACAAGPSCTLSLNRQVAGASLPVLQAISNGSIVIGDGSATAVSITTDSTGDGEVNLPVGSIGTTEILDGTVAFADVNSTQTLAGDPANGVSSVWHGTTGLIFEGATSDAFEGLLATADITTPDKTWTLPNETGTICTTGSVCSGYQAGPLSGDVVTSGAAATIQPDSVALTTDTTGDYVSTATASQGLLITGTEGSSVGLQDCAASELLQRNVGDTAWVCASAGAGPVAGLYIDVTGSTVDVDLTEATDVTWSDGVSALARHTFNLSGAADPKLVAINGGLEIESTGPVLNMDDTDIADGATADWYNTIICSAGPDCTYNMGYQANGGTQTQLIQGNSDGTTRFGGPAAVSVTIASDGTGDGELIVPDSSIATLEITDATIAFADINATQTLAGNPANGVSSVWFGTTGMIFEGATSDAFEGLLASADITTPDKTWTLPNETGTICTTGCVCAGYQAGPLSGDVVTSGAAATIQANSITEAKLNSADTPAAGECVKIAAGDVTAFEYATCGGGAAITLDLGDDAGNDSVALAEIATVDDTNNIFTESAADKLLITLSNDWPKADTADDLTCTNCIGPTEITDLTLGTDTAGNYMVDIAAGIGIATTHTPAEGSTGTIAFTFADAGTDPALGAGGATFSNEGASAAGLVFEGDTNDAFETRVRITDPTVADRIVTIPNADSVTVQPDTGAANNFLTAISALGVVSKAAITDGDVPNTITIDLATSASDLTCTNCIGPTEITDIALGTDTSGNYVADVVDGTGIDATGTAAEGWTATVNLNYANTLAGNVTMNAEECQFTLDGTGGGGFLCEGNAGGNTNEQLYLFPPNDAVDTTDFIKVTGKEMLFIPAAAMKANVTSPASCGDTYDSGSNDLTIPVCAFDTGATEERADFQVAMPKMWDEGTITYQALWTNTLGTAAQTVQWEVGCVAISDDDPLNAVMGTTVTQSDTWLAANDMHITAESSAVTCGGTPAENDYIAFRISRDTSVDNMTGDALLIGIRIFWTSNASNND